MEKVTIVSPVASVRFPNLTQHEVFDGVSTGKYSITLVFDPKDRKPLEDAISEAGGNRGKSPLKEVPSDAQYDAGMLILKAKSKYQVKAIDSTGELLLKMENVSQGSEVRVKLSFAPYTQSGGGVTCYLGNIQLLSGGSRSDLDFGDLPENYKPRSDEELDDELPF